MKFHLEEIKMKFKHLLIFLYTLLSTVLFSKDIPSRPNPPRLVNDFAGILSADENASLETKLISYFDSTSTQIAIIIENSIEDDDLIDYCQRIGETWGIGEKGKNNGLIIYVAMQDHKIRIHTGYGMEATIPDALTNRIINDYIKPAFRDKQYFYGLDQACDIIMQAANGEYVYDRPKHKSGKGTWKVIMIIIIIIIAVLNRRNGGGRGMRGFGSPFIGTFGGGGFSGGFGGSSDGGGFGGFGGGSFGGGGSSGSW